MKSFLKLVPLLLSLTATPAFAGSAIFTWIPPNPMWMPEPDGSQPTVPPGFTIDEYRIKCQTTHSDGSVTPFVKVVPGYTTTTATYNDLLPGFMVCHMTSYSAGFGTESAPSPTVSKEIVDITPMATPAAPIQFNFNQTSDAPSPGNN
jgi:hypothetical protein